MRAPRIEAVQGYSMSAASGREVGEGRGFAVGGPRRLRRQVCGARVADGDGGVHRLEQVGDRHAYGTCLGHVMDVSRTPTGAGGRQACLRDMSRTCHGRVPDTDWSRWATGMPRAGRGHRSRCARRRDAAVCARSPTMLDRPSTTTSLPATCGHVSWTCRGRVPRSATHPLPRAAAWRYGEVRCVSSTHSRWWGKGQASPSRLHV